MRVDGRPPSVEVATLIAVGSGSPASRACSNRAAKVALASDNRSMVVMRLLWAGCGHHRTRPEDARDYWTTRLLDNEGDVHVRPPLGDGAAVAGDPRDLADR